MYIGYIEEKKKEKTSKNIYLAIYKDLRKKRHRRSCFLFQHIHL